MNAHFKYVILDIIVIFLVKENVIYRKGSF